MELATSALKLKYKIKGIYNNAINKPIKDMCLLEMEEELLYRLKDVNKTGIWDNRTEAILRDFFSRKYFEAGFEIDVFLGIIDRLQNEKLKSDFIHKYANMIDEQDIILLDSNRYKIDKRFAPYIEQVMAEVFEKYGDFDKLPSSENERNMVLEKLTPTQVVDMYIKDEDLWLSDKIEINKLSKQDKLQLLSSDKYFSFDISEQELFDDITSEDVLQYCRNTGNYKIFSSGIKAVNQYCDTITYDKILNELQYLHDEKSQEYYFNYSIPLLELQNNITLEQYEMLANNNEIKYKKNIFLNIFLGQEPNEIIERIKALPEEQQKDAIEAVKSLEFYEKKLNDNNIREIYDNIKSKDVKRAFMIDITMKNRHESSNIFSTQEKLECLKEDGDFFFKDNIFKNLTQEELTELFFTTKNEKVKKHILNISIETYIKENKSNETNRISNFKREKIKFNIITPENIYDIFKEADTNNSIKFLLLDNFDINHEGVLEKIVSSRDMNQLIPYILQKEKLVDLSRFAEAISKIRNPGTAKFGQLSRLKFNWNGQDEANLLNDLKELSKVDNIYFQALLIESDLLRNNKMFSEEKMLFNNSTLKELLRNKNLSQSTRNILFREMAVSYWRQLEVYDKEELMQSFINNGSFDINNLFDEEKVESKDVQQILTQANDVIDWIGKDFPKEFSEQLENIKNMRSLELKADAMVDLSKIRFKATYDTLLKEITEYSKIVGVDYYTIFQDIVGNIDYKKSDEVRNKMFNYLDLLPYFVDDKIYNEFQELYANNKDVVKSITPEMLQPDVFNKIDKNLIEYLSAYRNSTENIADIVKNEQALKAFIGCYDELRKTNEYPEEKLSNLIKYLGKHVDQITKDEFSIDDYYLISYIANYDPEYIPEEGTSIFDYEKMIKEQCDKKMQSSLLTKATALDALGKRFFAMSYEDMTNIAFRYSKDIEKFIKAYESKGQLTLEEQNELTALRVAKNIKKIASIDDVETIKALYMKFSKMPEYENIDFRERIIFDESIRRPYTKDYKKNLYIPNEKDKKIVNGTEVYAPEDFTMFVHSVGAYSSFSVVDEQTTAKDLWESKFKTSSHELCTSFISEENMGSAGAKEKEGIIKKAFKKVAKVLKKDKTEENSKEKERVVLGFYDFSDNAIFMSGSNDLATVTYEIDSQKSYRDFSFKCAERLLNDTRLHYNEVNIKMKKADSANETLMPQYVVCYDEVTETDKKVANDFGIDIVLIDREKIAQKQSTQLNSLFEEFTKEPKPEIIKEIFNKYEGNWNSFSYTRPDLQMKYFNPSTFSSNMVKLIKQVQLCGSKGNNDVFRECMDALYMAIYEESEKFKTTENDHELFTTKNLQIDKISRALSKAISSTDYVPTVRSMSEKREEFLRMYEVSNEDISNIGDRKDRTQDDKTILKMVDEDYRGRGD